jgi:predicted transcriptional regulator
MKARTIAIARGELRPSPDDPKVWFTSVESFAKIMSEGNVELLDIIKSKQPQSLQELAEVSGRKKSNLSRTLRTMERYGIVNFKKGDHGRLAPVLLHDRVMLKLDLTRPTRLTSSLMQVDRIGVPGARRSPRRKTLPKVTV